jgi:hypothetical protein
MFELQSAFFFLFKNMKSVVALKESEIMVNMQSESRMVATTALQSQATATNAPMIN